jgi:L-lactate dehydrogenase complex protein LldG
MQASSKDIILKKIKEALSHKVPLPFPEVNNNQFLFVPQQQELELEFAQNFTELLGKFSFCANPSELVEQLQLLANSRNWDKIICPENSLASLLVNNGFLKINTTATAANCDAAITTCESLIARTGSILLSNANESGRTASVYAPVHICIAYTSQLVYDIANGLNNISTKYTKNLPSLISLATGPSRTADIEKTLVVGVHGPKEVFCFLIED